VGGLAGGREGAGDGDDDDFLVGELWTEPVSQRPRRQGEAGRNRPLLASNLWGMPQTLMSPSGEGGMYEKATSAGNESPTLSSGMVDG